MTSTPLRPSPSLFAGVAGQVEVITQLLAAAHRPVHAYLLVGPSGLQQRELVRGFAAALLCPTGGCGHCDTCRRVLSGVHPDLVEIERAGAQLAVGEAHRVVKVAYRRPHEAWRQVVVVPDLHLARLAAPVLLKTLEEPPASTVLVLLTESVTPELATVASRCVQLNLSPVPEVELVAWLEASGTDEDASSIAAHASGGSPDKARLFVDDPTVDQRRELWRLVPSSLDGTGATIVPARRRVARGGVERIRTTENPSSHRARGAHRQSQGGTGRKDFPGRREIEERHRREERRLRTDELRAGLAELARAYRDRAVEKANDPSMHARKGSRLFGGV